MVLVSIVSSYIIVRLLTTGSSKISRGGGVSSKTVGVSKLSDSIYTISIHNYFQQIIYLIFSLRVAPNSIDSGATRSRRRWGARELHIP